MITYPPGNTRRGQHIFPECVSEHAFGGWQPTRGELHRLLQKGEYNLTVDAPIFEGTFVQVTKRGELIGILNHPNIVILGILASTPTMLLPDLMIIARDKQGGGSKSRKLEIARLIPLELVDIYIHNVKERRLKIHMATGRNYYLQLCAPDGEEGFLFERWMRLIYLLHVASGKVKPPSEVPSKEVGLHTIWKTDSLPSETQYWLPAIMDKGSSAELQKLASRVSSARMGQKSQPSAVASKQSPSKSGALQPSSKQPSRTVQPQAYTSGARPPGSVSKDPSMLKSKSAITHKEQQMAYHEQQHPHQRFSTCRPCAFSPPPSRHSVGVETSEFDTASVGIGPSVPFTRSEAVGPSQPPSRPSPWASSQGRSTEQPGAAELREDVTPKEKASWEYGEVPIKLERSQKSRCLVEGASPQASQQKVSQSRSNAPSFTEKPATEARVPSQASSRGRSQMPSRVASTRVPSATPAARSRMSAAVGSTIAYTNTVAVGPSEVGAVSVAAGPSQPASRASRVPSARSKASQAVPFHDMSEEPEGAMRSRPISREMSAKSKSSEKPGTSTAPPTSQSMGRTSAADSQMAGMTEESEGAMQSRPISREMSAKPKSSEKLGTSTAPPISQSMGRTSAPDSQMTGMAKEPEVDMQSRPISREMSEKPKSSEKPGTSTAPSMSQGMGRKSAPDSQMTGMALEPEVDMQSRPISREMSAKPKSSEKQGTSAAPSRLQSPGRTSRPYSQIIGMAEEPEVNMQSRPISREMSAKPKSSEKQRTSAAPSRLQSPGRTSRPYSQMGGMETQKPSKTKSSKPVLSSGPSQEAGQHTPLGRTKKGWSPIGRKFMSVGVGPSEPGLKSVAVGPSQPWMGDRSRHRSRTPEKSKSVKVRTIFSRKKSKSGDKTQPSSATERQASPRGQASKSKSRLKEAVSSAKQRSSLTFVTIYSVLSSSMERLRRSKSKEDAKLQEEQLGNISAKPSKRVTISGVIGPAGKGVQTEEPFFASDANTLIEDEAFSTTATMGSEPRNISTPHSYTRTSQPTVVGSRVGTSVAPSKSDRPPSGQVLPDSRPSEKSAPSKEASINTEGLPPQSRRSVDQRTSTASTKPIPAGSSAADNWTEQRQPHVQSQTQSKMEDGWTPGSQPSAQSRPPERSRISVGAGSTLVDTKSEAVGPSTRGSLRDAAAGPSMAVNWGERGQSRIQSRKQSEMEEGQRPSSQPSAQSRPPERSRISVGAGSTLVDTKSEAVGPSVRGSMRDAAAGPSMAANWGERGESRIQSRKQSKMEEDWRPRSQPSAQSRPPERSRISVGVGRSLVDTKSAAVGPSTIGGWKEQSECRMHSQHQSHMDDNWGMSSRPSLGPGPPDRSRRSVAVGRSVVETKSVGVGRSQREMMSEGAGPSKPGSRMIARNVRGTETRLQEHSVFQPQGWLGAVEIEETPMFRTTATTTPRPSNRASRVATPSGGYGSR